MPERAPSGDQPCCRIPSTKVRIARLNRFLTFALSAIREDFAPPAGQGRDSPSVQRRIGEPLAPRNPSAEMWRDFVSHSQITFDIRNRRAWLCLRCRAGQPRFLFPRSEARAIPPLIAAGYTRGPSKPVQICGPRHYLCIEASSRTCLGTTGSPGYAGRHRDHGHRRTRLADHQPVADRRGDVIGLDHLRHEPVSEELAANAHNRTLRPMVIAKLRWLVSSRRINICLKNNLLLLVNIYQVRRP